MVLDTVREIVVLFGGGVASDTTNETWELNEAGWYQSVTPSSPPPRSFAAFAYHEARGAVILFGGLGEDSEVLGDTWVYRGVPCVPDCDDDRVCGDDGCGGECAPGCSDDQVCIAEGTECVTRWVRVEADSFTMGSPEEELGRGGDETQYEVTLTRDFEVLSTEVTFRQFEARMGYGVPWEAGCGDDCPVGRVSWNEAASYCNELSDDAGLPLCYSCEGDPPDVTCQLSGTYTTPYDCFGYRLPTEAEWEYAARAGDERATYNGELDDDHLLCETPNPVLDSIAWYCGNAPGRVGRPVGLLEPNDWGLYDMLGNRLEACHDWRAPYPTTHVVNPHGPTDGTNRVYRGGYAWTHARYARAASRQGFPPDSDLNLGFRPVRTLP